MKRTAFLSSLLLTCLMAGPVAFGQSDPKAIDKKPCPFAIAGLWRSSATSQNTPIFFNFSPEGYVSLMGHAPDTPPDEFEIITTVNYVLDSAQAPKRIEFTADRGNDFFLKGVTSFKITEYDTNSFTTLNTESGERTLWNRELTHRYFLTFVARAGSAERGPATFVMWTALDGRKNEVHALGVQMVPDAEGKPKPAFGPIFEDMYVPLSETSEQDKKMGKEDVVIMRLELTGGEFEKSHKVFETWDNLLKDNKLPSNDPYTNTMELITKAVESINPCGENSKLQKLNRAASDEITAKHNPPQRAMEYIRAMRKKNDVVHVSDGAYPWGWKPTVQLPSQ